RGRSLRGPKRTGSVGDRSSLGFTCLCRSVEIRPQSGGAPALANQRDLPSMPATRFLCVIADDYGIGPETSRGILEVAGKGALGGTVVLVNPPYAADAVRCWRQAGAPLEMGWHPCLTLDRPLVPPGRVPSLVGPDGNFWPLGKFLARVALGRVRAAEV